MADFEKTAYSTHFRGVLPPFGPQISAESGRATRSLAPGKPGWPPTSTWPLFSRPTPHAPPAWSGRARTLPAGYCHPPTAELTKTERDPISTSGPSIQYVTEPGNLFGKINRFLPARRRPTVDHSLVAGGAQRQARKGRPTFWHQGHVGSPFRPRFPSFSQPWSTGWGDVLSRKPLLAECQKREYVEELITSKQPPLALAGEPPWRSPQRRPPSQVSSSTFDPGAG